MIHPGFAFASLIIGLAVGATVGNFGAVYDMRKEAVRNGVAEWVSSENGSPQFQWRKP